MEETIKTVTHCPTCGAGCKVVGDVTHHYEPVDKETIKQLISLVNEYGGSLKYSNAFLKIEKEEI